MPFSEKEMREDLHKVRIRQYILFFGGLGILGLSIALFVLFLVRRDLPALILALIGFFWTAVLLQQAERTRRLRAAISSLLEVEGGAPGGGRPAGPGEAGTEAGEQPGEPAGQPTGRPGGGVEGGVPREP